MAINKTANVKRITVNVDEILLSPQLASGSAGVINTFPGSFMVDHNTTLSVAGQEVHSPY